MALTIIAYIVIGLYTLALIYITFYCLIQFHLLLEYGKDKRRKTGALTDLSGFGNTLPAVTIQLPIFNERFVVERLIDNMVMMDYPQDRLQIQVLDDSTDDTQQVCKDKVAMYKQKGVNIEYIHRQDREGYKAGALRDGLKTATGEFIAIFDADFLPHKDFLMQTLPYLEDERVGVVQTRWDHINGDYSLITKLQAFQCAENARKLLPEVFRSGIPFTQKIHAAAHLLSSSIFLVVFALAVLSVPTLFLVNTINLDMRFYWIFMLGILTVGWVYFVANSDTTWSDENIFKRIGRFVLLFPLFLSLSMGMSLHNSIAVIEGYRGKKSAFMRTPKFNIQRLQDTFKQGFYAVGKISGTTIIEGLLSLYFLSAVVMGVAQGKTSFLVYHIMLMIGFGSIFIYTIRHLSHR